MKGKINWGQPREFPVSIEQERKNFFRKLRARM